MNNLIKNHINEHQKTISLIDQEIQNEILIFAQKLESINFIEDTSLEEKKACTHYISLKCNNLINDIKKLERIAHKGHIKVTRVLKTDFESVIKKIVHITFNKNNI